MTRIEWSALGGDEVETVVSMLMFNEHPRATRIRPSRGDFGVDLLDPHPDDPVFKDVYQIKKFATNLDDSRKRQIEDSFQRVLVGLVRRGVPLSDWYLVMPLDPTIENELDWFAAMPDVVIARMAAHPKLALSDDEMRAIQAWREAPGRIIKWKGLTYCELLASKFWFVADYYLHGGSQRIRDAVADVARIVVRDITLPSATVTTAIMTPGELREHLGRLGRVLDGDPHFRYGFSVDPVAPDLHEELGIIAATQQTAPDGTCLTFRIYERFAEAVNERPIPIKLQFQFEPGSAEQQAFDEWRKYGKPLKIPASIDADLPGGLGGSLGLGTASISAAGGGTQTENRWRIVSPDGEALADLRFTLTSTTGLDSTGVWIQGSDPSGMMMIEGTIDATNLSGQFSFALSDATGREAVEVAPALTFAANLSHPNRLQVAAKYGPFSDFHDIAEDEGPLPLFVARYVAALASLQPYVATPITVPDLATVTGHEAQTVMRAAILVSGQTIVGTWERIEFSIDTEVPVDPAGHCQLAVMDALTAVVGADTLTIGAIQNTLMSVRLTDLGAGHFRAQPHLNNAVHQTFLPDEEPPSPSPQKPVRYRSAPLSLSRPPRAEAPGEPA